jgi:terminal uridylyltransferase
MFALYLLQSQTPETKFHVKPLPHARIPIVKLSLDPSPGLPLGIACDIGFENRLALENTRLLMCYAMVDPTRVRTMVLFRELLLSWVLLNPPAEVFFCVPLNS